MAGIEIVRKNQPLAKALAGSVQSVFVSLMEMIMSLDLDMITFVCLWTTQMDGSHCK